MNRPRGENVALILLSAYFLGRLLYFAVSIAPDIPPDESTHVGIIRLYAEAPLFVEDSPASYRYGLVTRVPYLYHLLMGKLLTLNILGLDTYLYLRLWNVVLAMATIVLAYKLAAELTETVWVRLLFMALATNTLMLTFLSASVSYDNLANLFAVLATFLVFRYLKRGRFADLLGCLVVMLLGSLTKVTFLPLALLLMMVIVVDRRRLLARDLQDATRALLGRQPAAMAWVALGILALGANLWLYGGNLIQFGNVRVSCSKVLSVEHCMENRIFARNWVLHQYIGGELDFEQAVIETGRIWHPGDRDHAIRLLNNERRYQQLKPEPMNVLSYTRLVWNKAMMPTIFGIQAHRSMLRDENSLAVYGLILLAAFILWVRHVRWEGSERLWVYLAAMAVAYVLLLVGFENYRGYLRTHAPLVGVQGRYLFPVLWAGYLVLARYLLKPFGKNLQIVITVALAAWFIAGDLPYFRRHVTPAWFADPPTVNSTRSPGQP